MQATRRETGGITAGSGAEVAPTIGIDREVTPEEPVAVEVDEPTAGGAESRTAAPVRGRL